MKQKILQLGSDNFGEVVTEKLGFVDKTLFIKEALDHRHIKVSIITRPRRFGKTFNLSMLHHFLASEVNGQVTKNLFSGLKIATVDNGTYMQHQGQYPVIFISFKDIESKTFAGMLDKIKLLINRLYETHVYLLKSVTLEDFQKTKYQQYLTSDLNEADIGASLETLSRFIYKHTGKKAYILIDEYDTPIQAGYLNGYYGDIIELIRSMFGLALKSNPCLERAVITGILRITKESLFFGLNNAQLYTIIDRPYSSHFGFTETEVHELLLDADLNNYYAQVKAWYNGYNFGGTTVYNPWSIVSFINSRGVFRPYWINTSGNDLIKTMLLQTDLVFKQQFELLLQDQTIAKPIDENIVFDDVANHSHYATWSLLAMSGYLKIISKTNDLPLDSNYYCAIPNLEVKSLYCKLIKTWLGGGELERYNDFLQALLTGNIPVVTESLQATLLQLASSYDMVRKPEAFYHGLWLGLLAGLDTKDYDVRSNQESGLGRYDIAIFPKDTTKSAIIMELKSLPRTLACIDNGLAQAANEALMQIKHKQYDLDAQKRGFANIIQIGIAFAGKACSVASNQVVVN